MRNPKILVIDSGIGGLSVTQHIRLLCPGVTVTYIADVAQFPYGSKSETEVTGRITTLVEYGVENVEPDLVVIACNTASTIALEFLRQRFEMPFIGVVPAIKPAAAASVTGVIGVLATTGTVSRPYTKRLIEQFAQRREVHLHGSSILVDMAERKLRGVPCAIGEIVQDLQPMMANTRMDTVVLACTHFPLLKNELTPLFPAVHFWVDSGEAIARRAAQLLVQMGLSFAGTSTTHQFIVTGDNAPGYKLELLTPLLGEFSVTEADI